jgi:RimJ/RimL family protein N-acetyltransferase
MPHSQTLDVVLRDVVDGDLPTFFKHQLDPVANHMAAFTRKDPSDRTAFDAHWAKIRADANVTIRTILHHGRVAGHVACYGPPDEREITYWIDREHWGQGIATEAVRQFLRLLSSRPLFARVAADNLGSKRVLEKCGFAESGRDHYFANARGQEIEEVILRLG